MGPLGLKELLEGMIGKTYRYKGKLTKLESFQLKKTYVMLCNTDEIYAVKYREIDKELLEYSYVERAFSLPPQSVLGSSGLELKNLLMENIKKVQENKGYIPQAIEVNNNVKSIIDLAKAEIEMYKALNSR